jgi:hypothetical protein
VDQSPASSQSALAPSGAETVPPLADQLQPLAEAAGRGAVAACVSLLAGRGLVADDIAALRDFARRLFDERRFSYLVALANALSASSAVSPEAAAIVGFYALRAQDMRQCYTAVERLHETSIAAHRARGAYAAWEERFINEALANALMKQARPVEAHAVIDAGLAAAPDHAGLRVLRARLLSSDAPARALAELRQAEQDARDAGAPLSAATLMAAELAAALGDAASVEESLQAAAQEPAPVPDACLALANLAFARGRPDEQRRWIDAWFAHYDLWSPASVGDGPFRVGAIPPSGLERRPDGPLVTVVMTTFNAAETVDYAVASVLDQTHDNLELFIVDDASRDATRKRLDGLAAKDRRVRLIRNARNVGPYVSKNRAITQSMGELVTFHDSDDWRHPQHLERHLALMTAEPRLVASRSAWSRIDADGRFVLMPWGSYGHANPAATMIRRRVFREIGLFDAVRVGGDTELWARIEARYGAAAQAEIPAPLALGLAHGRSLTTAGATAFDPDGANAPRLAYWEAQARWRDAMWLKGRPLFLGAPFGWRPFPAPRTIRA